MSDRRWWAHYFALVAAALASLTLGALAVGLPVTGVAIIAALAAFTSIALHITDRKRTTNGRYRKAPEAHRAGAGGGTGDGTRARRGARGGAGAGMSGLGIPGGPGGLNPNYFTRALDEAAIRALMGRRPQSASKAPKPTPRPAGEFDGRAAEFAAGVVTGTRSFDVDNLGRLIGVSYRSVWTPGENAAKCLKRDDSWMFQIVLGPNGTPQRVPEESRDEPHSIVDCSHGFYGYYEGSNDYYESGRVMGVVEAYGETVIGSRGFRASKARIAALHIPADIRYGTRRLIARNYPAIPTFDSFDAMVAEFPPDDAGNGLTPETDPDFWTRKA